MVFHWKIHRSKKMSELLKILSRLSTNIARIYLEKRSNTVHKYGHVVLTVLCKRKIVGRRRPLLQMDEQVHFFWKRLLFCSWCSVNFTSYYTSQPNDFALALLRRPEQHLSIKNQTDTQACVRTYTALT